MTQPVSPLLCYVLCHFLILTLKIVLMGETNKDAVYTWCL